jgi:cyclin B
MDWFFPQVPRKELQLVGISSMLIASRYEELLAPEVIFFLYGLLNVV